MVYVYKGVTSIANMEFANLLICHPKMIIDPTFITGLMRWSETRITSANSDLNYSGNVNRIHTKCYTSLYNALNSSAYRRNDSKRLFSEHMVLIQFLNINCKIILNWKPQNTFDDLSKCLQVEAWCDQGASHCPSQCSSRSMSPYVVTRSGGVKIPTWCLSMSAQTNQLRQLDNILKIRTICFNTNQWQIFCRTELMSRGENTLC